MGLSWELFSSLGAWKEGGEKSDQLFELMQIFVRM